MTGGDGFRSLLRAMLGPQRAEPESGPPYTHTLRLPETEEEMAVPPGPSFTVERGRHYENEPLSAPEPLQRMFPCSLLPLGDDASRYFDT